jgi:hypothetical protein
MMLWVVGKVTDYQSGAWEFIGVFDDERMAICACRTTMYFLGPVELNKVLPDETIPWEGAFYPLVERSANGE